MGKSCCDCKSKLVCKIWNPIRSDVGGVALSLISENDDIGFVNEALRLSDEAEKKAGEILGMLCRHYNN